MIDLSPSFMKQAKKLGVPENQVLLADLISIGYSETDAFTIAYPENAALSANQKKSIQDSVLKISIVDCE
jgi:hypothetical protein